MDISQATALGNRNRRKRRVGRGHGSGMGKMATRGHKGAGSRSGEGYRTLFLGGDLPLFRHFPKRGFSNDPFTERYLPINVQRLEAAFKDGDVVDPAALERAGVVSAPVADRTRASTEDPAKTVVVKASVKVKILGDGVLTKKLTIRAHACSKSALEKITKAGGTFEKI
jgi:large subunit ribosomal protein L15